MRFRVFYVPSGLRPYPLIDVLLFRAQKMLRYDNNLPRQVSSGSLGIDILADISLP